MFIQHNVWILPIPRSTLYVFGNRPYTPITANNSYWIVDKCRTSLSICLSLGGPHGVNATSGEAAMRERSECCPARVIRRSPRLAAGCLLPPSVKSRCSTPRWRPLGTTPHSVLSRRRHSYIRVTFQSMLNLKLSFYTPAPTVVHHSCVI